MTALYYTIIILVALKLTKDLSRALDYISKEGKTSEIQ